MLIAAMVAIDTRTTMDLDATIKGQILTEPEVAAIVGEILSVPVDDNVILTLRDIEEIREESDYHGYRVSIEAILDKTRQTKDKNQTRNHASAAVPFVLRRTDI